jgi:dipeptidase E
MESGNPLLDDYVLGLAGAKWSRVCFLPSASGDADHYIARFLPAPAALREDIAEFRRLTSMRKRAGWLG